VTPPATAIIEAASVLLARAAGSDEVLLVGRSPSLRFMGGFHAFPGGKMHSSDAALAASAGVSGRHVAAVRELFEETGVLLARRADDSFPTASDTLAEGRRDLLAERIGLGELLSRWSLQLHADDLRPAGSLVTPPFAPLRFDTAFYAATLPPGQHAEVWPGELTDGSWASAEKALTMWTAGNLLLSPPTVTILEVLRGRPISEMAHRLRPTMDLLAHGRLPPIWFAPAVQMIPLFCDGLPPSTHTNAWLVGTEPVYLLDPGPTDRAEQERLFEVLDEQAAAGRRLSAVVLTHHHPDHVGAAAVCARRYNVPVRGHPWTATALAGQIEVVGDLDDGDRLDLGSAPDGHRGWHLQALHTPGHAPGHLAFFEPHYRLLFAGDLVSTLSSVVIAPPQGDLAVYLASLRRALGLTARLLLPAHGPVSARPAFVLEECLTHRREREEQLLHALASGPRSAADLAAEIYRGVPAPLMRFAELQVLAGLQKLHNEGLATPSDGECWQRTF
jgi:glyoxylase-like metal-dependent hydrolase (beta-lactamase superfamily II)/8-oxo-dGTP pyrophosphatase MutT (NUDIX family)